jgi:hypothetical protein
LEHLPLGTRVAYDLERGRLWQVCGSCRRWSLIPLDARWESLEELEAIVEGSAARGLGFSGRVRLLGKTDHISLLRIGTLEVIRVGRSGLIEEALWRYGGPAARTPTMLRELRASWRRKRFGTLAWKGERACQGCGHVFTELSFWDRKILVLTPEVESGRSIDSFSLARRCPLCREVHQGGLHLSGVEADFALARIMAFERPMGSPRGLIEGAVRVIQDVGGPSALIRLVSRHGRQLGDLPPLGSVAVEIYGAEAREKALLSLEAAVLDTRWREEELLAALVDGELTSVPALGALKRRDLG